MACRLYCLTDPDEPGLVRVVTCPDGEAHAIRRAGERVAWSLKMRDARRAMAALHRVMGWYRKRRGGGVYRCTPRHAYGIVLRYAALPRRSWRETLAGLRAALTAPAPKRLPAAR